MSHFSQQHRVGYKYLHISQAICQYQWWESRQPVRRHEVTNLIINFLYYTIDDAHCKFSSRLTPFNAMILSIVYHGQLLKVLNKHSCKACHASSFTDPAIHSRFGNPTISEAGSTQIFCKSPSSHVKTLKSRCFALVHWWGLDDRPRSRCFSCQLPGAAHSVENSGTVYRKSW